MLTLKSAKLATTVSCPKCQTPTQNVQLRSLRVNRCPAGCGVWISQAEMDSLSRLSASASAQSTPTAGLWRSRSFTR